MLFIFSQVSKPKFPIVKITLLFFFLLTGHIYNPKRILRVKDPDLNLNFGFFLYLLKPLASHDACFADYDNTRLTNRYRKMTEVSFNNKYNQTCRLHYIPYHKFIKSKITSETKNKSNYRTLFLNTIHSWRNGVFNLFPAWNYNLFWVSCEFEIRMQLFKSRNSINAEIFKGRYHQT